MTFLPSVPICHLTFHFYFPNCFARALRNILHCDWVCSGCIEWGGSWWGRSLINKPRPVSICPVCVPRTVSSLSTQAFSGCVQIWLCSRVFAQNVDLSINIAVVDIFSGLSAVFLYQSTHSLWWSYFYSLLATYLTDQLFLHCLSDVKYITWYIGFIAAESFFKIYIDWNQSLLECVFCLPLGMLPHTYCRGWTDST